MNKAAKELNMSYRALWGRIKSTEERIGARVLVTRSGGGEGCGSSLTSEGKKLVQNYKRLKEAVVEVADHNFENIFVDESVS
jgi:molybdate transport system regulatory protein